jgi:hypothetical protein
MHRIIPHPALLAAAIIALDRASVPEPDVALIDPDMENYLAVMERRQSLPMVTPKPWVKWKQHPNSPRRHK